MTLSLRHPLPALTLAALAAFALLAPTAASAEETPGYMACFVNRVGNNPRFFHTGVFQRDLEDRQASALALENKVHGWSQGKYRLESNCIWHALKAPVENKIADIVAEAEKADIDTFKIEQFWGKSQ